MLPQVPFERNGSQQDGLDLQRLAKDITASIESRGSRPVRKEHIFHCPVHDDHNPSASWNEEKATWCCRSQHCHEQHGGGAIALAKLLGLDVSRYRSGLPYGMTLGPVLVPSAAQIELPLSEGPAGSSSPSNPTLQGFAANRGLNADDIAAIWGIEEIHHAGRPALAYYAGLKMPRRIKHLDGGQPKYLWEFGKKSAEDQGLVPGTACPYGLPLATDDLRRRAASVLYVVNGEPSVWAAHTAGVAAICFCSGEGRSSAAASLAPEIAKALEDIGRPIAVRVAYDADGTGRDGGPKVAAALAAAGLDAAALDLAAWQGWSEEGPPHGADVGDMFQAAGVDGLAAALASLPLMPAEPPTADPPPAHAGADVTERWQGIPYCPPGQWECDDYGNGGRLVTLYGDRLRWHAARKAWLTFDGRRWVHDKSGIVPHLVRLTVRSILIEAGNEPDDDRKNALVKWHKASANGGRPGEMLSRARIDLTTAGEAWDADPWVLNVANGTVDLRTGELRPHDPTDFLTLLAPVEYHPGAHLAEDGPLAAGAALWSRFLTEVTGGDAEFAGFLQRAAGATLSGDARGTDALFFIFGPGGTGKSSFANAIARVLGDYADTIDAGALMKARDATGPRPEIAKLQGKRMAVAFEAESHRAFNDALLKTVTGGDAISARMLHANPVTFVPQFTLWLVGNYQPRANVNDSGFWRRVKTLPFTVRPAGPPDPTLRDRLPLEAGAAILAWAVEGCLAWKANGLGPAPSAVATATEEYRRNVDPLADWLEDRCVPRDGAWTGAGKLYDDYRAWAMATGDVLLGQREFGEHLTARLGRSATRSIRGVKVRGYAGIGLVSDASPGRWNSGTDGTEKIQNSLKSNTPMEEKSETSVPTVPLFPDDQNRPLLPGEF